MFTAQCQGTRFASLTLEESIRITLLVFSGMFYSGLHFMRFHAHAGISYLFVICNRAPIILIFFWNFCLEQSG